MTVVMGLIALTYAFTVMNRAEDSYRSAALTQHRAQARTAAESAALALASGRWKPSTEPLTVGRALVHSQPGSDILRVSILSRPIPLASSEDGTTQTVIYERSWRVLRTEPAGSITDLIEFRPQP